MITPEQLQSEIDSLFAEAQRLMIDGERRAASHLLSIMRRWKEYLPPEAVEAPSAPVEAPEPVPAPTEPETASEPPTRFKRRPKGV
jgi:hypothetical protein